MCHIKLDQYINKFREKAIDGHWLVAAKNERLNALGVSSSLHCFKIQYLFKRWLQNTPTTHSLAVVNDFLAANKMHEHVQRFAEEGVDGDMLLEILKLDTAGERILIELGVTEIALFKIKTKFIKGLKQ